MVASAHNTSKIVETNTAVNMRTFMLAIVVMRFRQYQMKRSTWNDKKYWNNRNVFKSNFSLRLKWVAYLLFVLKRTIEIDWNRPIEEQSVLWNGEINWEQNTNHYRQIQSEFNRIRNRRSFPGFSSLFSITFFSINWYPGSVWMMENFGILTFIFP